MEDTDPDETATTLSPTVQAESYPHIQRRLGHASIRTTADVYGSLPESIDRAVADQLDDLLRPAGGPAAVHGGDSTGSTE